MSARRSAAGMLVLAVVAAMLAAPQVATMLVGGGKAAYSVERILTLSGAHAWIAIAAVVPAALIGVAAGVFVTRVAGRPLRPLADMLAAASQAVPPVVVVALAFPVLGFGAAPTVLALLIYCVMPVLRGTIGGLESSDPDPGLAARAMGMTPAGVLWQVELPLALPAIASAIRVAAILAISTAAVGALAGASTLGTPIIVGLQNQNEVYILQGAAATAALAFAADAILLFVQASLLHFPLAAATPNAEEWPRAGRHHAPSVPLS